MVNGIDLLGIFRSFGQRAALIGDGPELDYEDFSEEVQRLSAALTGAGIKRGERVGVLAENSIDYGVLFPALWYCGAVAVPLSTRLPAEQVRQLLRHSACAKWIVSRSFPQPAGFYPSEPLCLEDLVAAGSPMPSASIPQALSPYQAATIIFTSGSGGRPKGVLHNLANHYFSALGANHNIPFGEHDCWLLSLPLYHVGGLAVLLRAWMGGGAVAVPPPGLSLETALNRFPVTHVSLVATQLYRLLQREEGRIALRRLKAILLGGSAIPPGLIEQAHALKLPIYTSYGSTELASQVAATLPGANLEQLQTSGKVLSYREIKIAADGEILLSGETLFQGYIEKGRLMPARDADGWFASGDLGEIDGNGYLRVLGRRDNMFISGGENIQPEEIEACLSRIAGVSRAMVVGVPDAEFGKRPAAFVALQTGVPLDPKQLRRALEIQLPRFKIPDYFFPWPEEEPQTGIKPDRRRFAQLALQWINKKNEPGRLG